MTKDDVELVERLSATERACRLISLDNGGINRGRTAALQLRQARAFIAAYPADMAAIDKWLGGLTDDEMETICAGDADESVAILATAPPFTDAFLNDYFDEVC